MPLWFIPTIYAVASVIGGGVLAARDETPASPMTAKPRVAAQT
jgi:hypothetical protein